MSGSSTQSSDATAPRQAFRTTQANDAARHRSSRPRAFRLLFVCTANRCRSPLAERLFRQALGRQMSGPSTRRWSIASAGTAVERGTTIHPQALTVLAERGADDRPASARQLTTQLITAADLVLTATRAHRAWVVSSLPAATRRTFTIQQFARFSAAGRSLTGSSTVDTGAALMELANVGRTSVQPLLERVENIADPAGYRTHVFRESADELAWCFEAMLGPSD